MRDSVDDTKIPSGLGPSKGDTRAFSPGAILDWPTKDIRDVLLRDVVAVDVGEPRFRIDEVSDVYRGMLSLPTSHAN